MSRPLGCPTWPALCQRGERLLAILSDAVGPNAHDLSEEGARSRGEEAGHPGPRPQQRPVLRWYLPQAACRLGDAKRSVHIELRSQVGL